MTKGIDKILHMTGQTYLALDFGESEVDIIWRRTRTMLLCAPKQPTNFSFSKSHRPVLLSAQTAHSRSGEKHAPSFFLDRADCRFEVIDIVGVLCIRSGRCRASVVDANLCSAGSVHLGAAVVSTSLRMQSFHTQLIFAGLRFVGKTQAYAQQ